MFIRIIAIHASDKKYTCLYYTCHNISCVHFTNPNHPKSSKGHFIFEKFSTFGNWYFHLFNGAKLLPGKKYRPLSAEYERSTTMHGAF